MGYEQRDQCVKRPGSEKKHGLGQDCKRRVGTCLAHGYILMGPCRFFVCSFVLVE